MEWFTKNANFAIFAGSIAIFFLAVFKCVSFFTLSLYFLLNKGTNSHLFPSAYVFSLLEEVEGGSQLITQYTSYTSRRIYNILLETNPTQPESVGGWQEESYDPYSSVPSFFLDCDLLILTLPSTQSIHFLHHQLQVSSWHELQTAGTVTKLRQGLRFFLSDTN